MARPAIGTARAARIGRPAALERAQARFEPMRQCHPMPDQTLSAVQPRTSTDPGAAPGIAGLAVVQLEAWFRERG